MKDCLVLSSGKNKSSVFNGLQAKITGSNPVALTIFPYLDSGSKYNDIAKTLLANIFQIYCTFIKTVSINPLPLISMDFSSTFFSFLLSNSYVALVM